MSRSIKINQEVILAFAKISGDYSPLHVDCEFARLSRFRSTVSHGMFSAILLLSHLKEKTFPTSLQVDFLSAVLPGDSLVLDDKIKNSIARRLSDGKECLEAQFTFSEKAENINLPVQATAFSPQLSLNDYRTEELAGKKESFHFQADQKRVSELNNLLKSLGCNPLSDSLASFSLFLGAVSAVVGMRLPGKSATLSDFTWKGIENPGAVPVQLELLVEEVLEGSKRAVLKLNVFHGERKIGEGNVTVIVQNLTQASISCEEIKSAASAYTLKGKTAWVVGASRGIGNTIAKLLALSGANVALQYYQGRTETENSVRDILESGGNAIALQGDIRNPEQAKEVFDKISSQWGGVDIFISTAVENVLSQNPLLLSSSQLESEMKTTLFGLHDSLRLVLPHMQTKKSGKVVLVSSIYTELPEKGQLRYITAKSALTGYVRSLALELAEDNIQVNLVVPAMTETSLLSSVPAGLLERLRAEGTNGRLLSPLEVASAVLFLASSQSSAISGQRLVLNRGVAPFL